MNNKIQNQQGNFMEEMNINVIKTSYNFYLGYIMPNKYFYFLIFTYFINRIKQTSQNRSKKIIKN